MGCSVQLSESQDNVSARVQRRTRRQNKTAKPAEQYTGNLIAFRLRDGGLRAVTSNMPAMNCAPATPLLASSLVPISRGKSVLLANLGCKATEQSESISTIRQMGQVSRSIKDSMLDTAASVVAHRNTIALAVLAALTGGLFAGSSLTTGLMHDTSQSANRSVAMASIDSSSMPAARAESSTISDSASMTQTDTGLVAPTDSDFDSRVVPVSHSLTNNGSNQTEAIKLDYTLSANKEQVDVFLEELDALRTVNDSLRAQADSLKSEKSNLTSELLALEMQFSSLTLATQPLTEIRTIYNFVNLPTENNGAQSDNMVSPSWENNTGLYSESASYQEAYALNDQSYNTILPLHDERGFLIPFNNQYGTLSEEDYYEQLYYQELYFDQINNVQ